MSLICSGCNCSKNKGCGRCIDNLSYRYMQECNTVENLATFGSGSLSYNGIEENYMCGPNGGYKMFEPTDSIADWHMYTKDLAEERYKVKVLEQALNQAVNDRNYLAAQVYLNAVDDGKLSVDFYIEQAKKKDPNYDDRDEYEKNDYVSVNEWLNE